MQSTKIVKQECNPSPMQSHLDIASSLSHCFKQIKSALQKLEVTPLKVLFDNAMNLNPAGYCQAAEKITFQMFLDFFLVITEVEEHVITPFSLLSNVGSFLKALEINPVNTHIGAIFIIM